MRERARDDDALALAAGELGEGAVGEREHAGTLHRALGGGDVVRALEADAVEVRCAADQHHLGDAIREGNPGLLRHDGDRPRERAAVVVAEIPAAEPDAPRRRPARPGEEPEQRRFAGSVRSRDRQHLALVDGERNVGDRPPAAVREAHVLGLEQRGRRHPVLRRSRRNRYVKNGAPQSAVTTPTGISLPPSAVRAIVSAQTRKIAPPR